MRMDSSSGLEKDEKRVYNLSVGSRTQDPNHSTSLGPESSSPTNTDKLKPKIKIIL